MADTFKKLAQTSLTTISEVVEIYTAPSSTETIIKHIRVVNRSPAAAAVQMWHKNGPLSGVPSTDSAYLILPKADIADGGWAEFEGTIILNADDSLYASVEEPSIGNTGSDITIVVYGLEMA